jgi:uncharacterized protein YndB with AHSA1/START domain
VTGYRIALAVTVDGPRRKVFDVLRTTEGLQAFWTTDCEVSDRDGRFGFLQAPVDLVVKVSLVEDELVSMTVTSGFPGWHGSTWQWSLRASPDDDKVTMVQFRHFGFASDHGEDAVAYTAQTWAMVLERLARYVTSGVADPFFTNVAT